jgi:hypothetical protein
MARGGLDTDRLLRRSSIFARQTSLEASWLEWAVRCLLRGNDCRRCWLLWPRR